MPTLQEAIAATESAFSQDLLAQAKRATESQLGVMLPSDPIETGQTDFSIESSRSLAVDALGLIDRLTATEALDLQPAAGLARMAGRTVVGGALAIPSMVESLVAPPKGKTRPQVAGSFVEDMVRMVGDIPSQLDYLIQQGLYGDKPFQPTKFEDLPAPLKTLAYIQTQLVGAESFEEAQVGAVERFQQAPESLPFGLGIGKGIGVLAKKGVGLAGKVKTEAPLRIGEEAPPTKLPSVEEGVTPEIVRELQKPPESLPPAIPIPNMRTGGTTALNKAEIETIRPAYGYEQMPIPQKKGFNKSLAEAKAKGYDINALQIADEVNLNRRGVTDAEHVGMVLKEKMLENDFEVASVWREQLLNEGKYDAAIIEKQRMDALSDQIQRLTSAASYSGTELARAFGIRRIRIAQDLSIGRILFNAEQVKGKRLTNEEMGKFQQYYTDKVKAETELADMTAKFEQSQSELNRITAERVINQQLRGKRTTVKREQIRADRENIKKQLREMGFRVNDITGASVEALYRIGQLAKSYAREGALKFDEIISNVKRDLPDLTERDIIQAIATKDPKLQGKLKSDATKRVAELTQQARLLVEIEKVEQGIFAPRKDRAIAPESIRELQKKLTELRKQAYKSGLDGAKLERSLRLIDELQDQLANQYRAIKKKQTIPTGELAGAKARIVELRKQLRTEDVLADLNEQLRTGDFKLREKPQPEKLPVELERLQVEVTRKRRIIRDAIEAIGQKLSIREPLKSAKIIGKEAINLARTLKATADMSATLRQGLLPSIHLLRKGKIVQLAKIEAQGVKSFFSEYTADQIHNAIVNADNHYLREQAGLYIAERGAPRINLREEYFMSRVADKIPVVKQITRASERHMTTTLNLLRASMFDLFLEKYPNATRAEMKAWADVVNTASGRGNIKGGLNNLNNIFFAPRFAASRFQTPLKMFQYFREPRVRNEIIKDMSSAVGLGLATLEIAHLAGADVGLDPRDPDFGKIRFGDTRIDIWAGFQQPARLIAGLATNITDRAGITGEGLPKAEINLDPLETIGRFAAFKLSPAITIPRELWTGKTAIGEDTTPKETAIRSLIPIVYEDFYDNGFTREAVVGAALQFPGLGVNTYQDSKMRVRKKLRELLIDGKEAEVDALANNWNLLNKDKIRNITLIRGADTLHIPVGDTLGEAPQ